MTANRSSGSRSRGNRSRGNRSRGIRDVAAAVLLRPGLWPAAIATMFRLAQPGWWRTWPPLPVPSEGLWRLRMLTAYGGDGSAEPDAADVRSYLDWTSTARTWRRR